MFGDDPDPAVTTEWVGFGTIFGRTHGVMWLCKEGVGLRRERRRQPGNSFRRPKTSDEYTDYIAVIYLTVGQSNGLRMR